MKFGFMEDFRNPLPWRRPSANLGPFEIQSRDVAFSFRARYLRASPEDRSDEGNRDMRESLGTRILAVAGALAFLALEGCVATRNWVREQLDVVNGRVDGTERRLSEVDGKADRALAGLQNLQLEQKFVLDMKEGATFTSGSAGLAKRAKTEIDRFLNELGERVGATEGAVGRRVFVVAGHTDSTGPEDFNYELGQRRASRVAAYLVGEKGLEPLSVHVVSYGATKPLDDNKTRSGRQRNRRIEILVYQERVGSK